MKKETILKRAIENAIKKGYNPCEFGNEVVDVRDSFVWIGNKKGESCGMYIDSVLFSHDFCKALFGIQPVCSGCGEKYISQGAGKCMCSYELIPVPAWIYNGWRLFESNDRLEYISKFLKEDK